MLDALSMALVELVQVLVNTVVDLAQVAVDTV